MTSNIFWPDNPLIRGLLVALLCLFVWGLFMAFRAVNRVNQELKVAKNLKQRSDLPFETAALTTQLGTQKDSLAGRLLLAMLKQQGLAFARPADSLEPILDEVSRILAPVRTIPNLLLLFGLIGTVVGLAFTLSSLGPQIQGAINSGEPQAVARSLGLTLREMSGAFAGTLWGVTSAFVLQGVNAWTSVQAERLVSELDEVALEFSPQIYPAGSEKQLASLQELVMRSEQFLADTQQKISETSDKFAAVLTESGGVIRDSLSTLQATSQTIAQSLLKASGDVRQSSDQLSTAVDAIQRHRDDFRNVYTSFNEMFERSMQALKLHSDSELNAIRDMQSEFGKTGADIVQEIFKSSEKLGQVSSDIARAEAGYRNLTQDVANSIKTGFTGLDQQLNQTLGLYTTEVNAVSTHLGALGVELQQVQQASKSLAHTITAKDDVDRTRAKDQHLRDQFMLAATEKLSARLEEVSPKLAALNPALLFEELTQGQVQAANRHAEALEQVHAALDRHGGQQTQAHHDVRAGLKEMALLLTGLLDQLGQQLDALHANRAGTDGLRETLSEHAGASLGRFNELERQLTHTNQLLSDYLQGVREDVKLDRQAAQLALEQTKETGAALVQQLNGLPERLRADELLRSHQALNDVMGRLVLNSKREIEQPTEGAGQPA